MTVVITNYRENSCKNVCMVTRKELKVVAMESTEYTDVVELKTTFEVSAIYVAYNSEVVKDTVQCSRGFSHMVEFNVL